MPDTIRTGVAVLVLLALLAGATALAASPKRPANCDPCGGEFKQTQPSSCGLLLAPVDAYRANGEFVATYDNRCFACSGGLAFCTVPKNVE